MSTFHGGQSITPLCVTAKGVNYVKKYIGENINYQDVKTTTLELTFNNQDKTVDTDEDLHRYVAEIQNYDRIGNYGTIFIPISGGSMSFTRARIIKADFPTSPNTRETGVGWGKIILVIEQKIMGDLTSLAGHPDYVDLTTIPSTYWEMVDDLSEDFAGIRPKLQAPGGPSQDFIIKNETENGYHNFINLIGIESPGLTSSLAIAEYVKEIID